MQIILRGPAAGYEAEHTARIFPRRRKAENFPEPRFRPGGKPRNAPT